jgi:hypothetical protein
VQSAVCSVPFLQSVNCDQLSSLNCKWLVLLEVKLHLFRYFCSVRGLLITFLLYKIVRIALIVLVGIADL